MSILVIFLVLVFFFFLAFYFPHAYPGAGIDSLDARLFEE